MIWWAIGGYTACVAVVCFWVGRWSHKRLMRKEEGFQIKFASLMQRAMGMYEQEEWRERQLGDKWQVIARFTGVYGYGATPQEAREAAAKQTATTLMLYLTTGDANRIRTIPSSTTDSMVYLTINLFPVFSDLLSSHDIHYYKRILRNRLAKE